MTTRRPWSSTRQDVMNETFPLNKIFTLDKTFLLNETDLLKDPAVAKGIIQVNAENRQLNVKVAAWR